MLSVAAVTTLFPNAAQPRLGGFVERSLRALAAEPDIELSVIAPLGVPPWPLSAHPRYRALAAVPHVETWSGLTVHRPRFALVPGVGWRLNPALLARAVAPLIAGAEVVHADFLFPCGVGAVRAAVHAGLPVTLKARGSDVHWWAARPGPGAMIRRALEQADGVLAVSAALKRDMGAIGLPAGRVRVHYTGVDMNGFRPLPRADTRAALGVGGPLVVAVGNLIPLKRQALIVRAVAALAGVKLCIVGEGPERARLEALIAELGVGDRMQLLGSRPHGEVARWLAAADVLAHASEREGLANVWVEARACGTPVVTTDVGGAVEVVDSPEAGRLAEPHPQAFAAAIAQLLADPPAPEAVRAGLGERFSWAAHAAALAEILRAAARRDPALRAPPPP
ncbi:MAG: glycosyltransferase [Sphingomonadaceae bacterium]|nr:glycosyltransferase [Sphingomonadaceae bacterium]